MASAAMDYLNAAVAGLDGAACGDLLIALGEVQAKLTAAHAALLYRFDAADAHDAERYGSSSAWLAAKAGLPKKAARAAVRQMRQLRERPLLGDAGRRGITDAPAFTIADWTRKLPGQMREETDRILLEAAVPRRAAAGLRAAAPRQLTRAWKAGFPTRGSPQCRVADRRCPGCPGGASPRRARGAGRRQGHCAWG